MIEEIYIKNFILIKEQSICFKKGLNIITGETGAGKSIILKAISLLIGESAKPDYIGDYGNSSIIEGTFTINNLAKEFLDINGMNSENEQVIITREINRSSSTITRLNGRRITVKLLKQLSNYLLDFHGQNEHQSLLKVSNHIHYLDNIKSNKIKPYLLKIANIYKEYNENIKKLEILKSSDKIKNREIDFIKFQLKEINELNLKKDEIENLEKEYKFLSNSENISKIIGNSLSDIKSDNQIYDKLQAINFNLKSIEKFDEAIKDLNKEVKDIYYLTEVLIEKMANYYNSIEYDEYRLNDINSRISDINIVMKKYGNSYDILIQYKESLNEKLNEYNSIEEKIINLEKDNLILLDQYNQISTDITAIRFEFAEVFEKRIKEEFTQLNMKNSNIKVSITEKDKVSKNGKDNVELLISTNLGQPFRPLKEIVSGGELSRTMLGIKLITKEINNIPTLIFDEVDTGISGLTANIIGKKLKSISKDLQVITITHLPQIAAFANNHISVVKSIDKLKNVTISKVRILDDKGKIDEIAKLISGKNITNSSIKSANELIQKSM